MPFTKHGADKVFNALAKGVEMIKCTTAVRLEALLPRVVVNEVAVPLPEAISSIGTWFAGLCKYVLIRERAFIKLAFVFSHPVNCFFGEFPDDTNLFFKDLPLNLSVSWYCQIRELSALLGVACPLPASSILVLFSAFLILPGGALQRSVRPTGEFSCELREVCKFSMCRVINRGGEWSNIRREKD